MPTNIGIAKQILSKLLGLSPITVDKVIRQIQSSGDILNIQTNNIRKKIGPQSLAMIMKGLDASGSISDYEAEGTRDDEDRENDVDMNQEQGAEEVGSDKQTDWDEDEDADEMFPGTNKDLNALKIRERIHFSLKDYLINEENMVNIDLSDPAAAQQEIRQLSRIAKASPDRVRRKQQQEINAEKKTAAVSDGPTKSLDQQIAMTKQKLLQLNKRRSDVLKRSGE